MSQRTEPLAVHRAGREHFGSCQGHCLTRCHLVSHGMAIALFGLLARLRQGEPSAAEPVAIGQGIVPSTHKAIVGREENTVPLVIDSSRDCPLAGRALPGSVADDQVKRENDPLSMSAVGFWNRAADG